MRLSALRALPLDAEIKAAECRGAAEWLTRLQRGESGVVLSTPLPSGCGTQRPYDQFMVLHTNEWGARKPLLRSARTLKRTRTVRTWT